jgi:hypothetical protein
VFPLVWNSSVEARAAMRPNQSLLLFMPLTSVSLPGHGFLRPGRRRRPFLGGRA